VALKNGDRVMPDPILVRPQRGQARGAGEGARHHAMATDLDGALKKQG